MGNKQDVGSEITNITYSIITHIRQQRRETCFVMQVDSTDWTIFDERPISDQYNSSGPYFQLPCVFSNQKQGRLVTKVRSQSTF